MMKTYRDLIKIPDYYGRLEYLACRSTIGVNTFGTSRWINQAFYSSEEWKRLRKEIILRDNGCDLGLPGLIIPDGVPIYVHHINPISVEDLEKGNSMIFDPENLICCTNETHRQIHYGFKEKPTVTERRPGDTKLW